MKDRASWRDAVCHQEKTHPEIFHEEMNKFLIDTAKGVCRRCPVQRRCLEAALAENAPGIWGGTTERERRKLLRATH